MHIHILGICGTFMGGLALIAREQGHRVTGSDAHVYPPMSTQLREQGIELIEGYDESQLSPSPDLVVVGNALSRGNPCVEFMLNERLPYTSGAQFLSDYVLKDKWVLAVAGTHGKTTTASMLAWILEQSGNKTGFLIGGIPQNFGVSARLGESEFFVVEADEYDSAFFDKRSKFVHYHPRTLVINNLEFDHADIFDSLADIQKQFHHVVRLVPSEGCVCYPPTEAIMEVIEQGCWSNVELVTEHAWQIKKIDEAGSHLEIQFDGQKKSEFHWSMIGDHNANNALMACLAAKQIGISLADSTNALTMFEPPKRRLECLIEYKNIKVFDDFAHHPTAIETTLKSLRDKYAKGNLLAVFEPRSATMKQGVHQETLAKSLALADYCALYQDKNLSWDLASMMKKESTAFTIFSDIDTLVQDVMAHVKPHDVIVIMSNGGFDGVHQKIVKEVQNI